MNKPGNKCCICFKRNSRSTTRLLKGYPQSVGISLQRLGFPWDCLWHRSLSSSKVYPVNHLAPHKLHLHQCIMIVQSRVDEVLEVRNENPIRSPLLLSDFTVGLGDYSLWWMYFYAPPSNFAYLCWVYTPGEGVLSNPLVLSHPCHHLVWSLYFLVTWQGASCLTLLSTP